MGTKTTPSNSGKRKQGKGSAPNRDSQLAAGGELHQLAGGGPFAFTTNQGVALSDNQNSLRALADTQLGLVTLASKADFDTFIETAKKQRIWHRERLARPPR